MNNNQTNTRIEPPTRNDMRFMFELALRGTELPSTKARIHAIIEYFESSWMFTDAKAMKMEDSSENINTE